MKAPAQENRIATLRDDLKMKVEDFAAKLGCSKGHVSDLCTGRRPVTHRIALKLEGLSGRPWHEWMDAAAPVRAPQKKKAA